MLILYSGTKVSISLKPVYIGDCKQDMTAISSDKKVCVGFVFPTEFTN